MAFPDRADTLSGSYGGRISRDLDINVNLKLKLDVETGDLRVAGTRVEYDGETADIAAGVLAKRQKKS